jgi:hypothetical protein
MHRRFCNRRRIQTEIETSANAAFAERVAAAAKAVVPKSNLRIAYPLFNMFSK